MLYDDGYETNDNLRFVKCPKCGNEEYSSDAEYCRICGFPAYNKCEGSPEYDENGDHQGFHVHRNQGNARFCEYCGKPTMLFNEEYLKSYTEINTEAQMDGNLSSFDLDDDIPF